MTLLPGTNFCSVLIVVAKCLTGLRQVGEFLLGHGVRGCSPPWEERHCRVCGGGRMKWRAVYVLSVRKQSLQAGTKDGCHHQRFASSDMVLPTVKNLTDFKIALQAGIGFHNISVCMHCEEAFRFKQYHLCHTLHPPTHPQIMLCFLTVCIVYSLHSA